MFLLKPFFLLRNLIIKFLIKILPKKNTGKQISNRQSELLDKYNKGLILQVDNEVNNKEYFNEIKNG